MRGLSKGSGLMTPEIETELRRLYVHFKKNFDKFPMGHFTSIGDENGVHITMLYMHGWHEMCTNYSGYSNHWHGVQASNVDDVFEQCINEAKRS